MITEEGIMMENYRIRTDLALETTERFKEEQVEIRGVVIQEKYDKERDIKTTVVKIETENGAKAMGRPQGTYITLEAPNLSVPDEDYHREISREIAHHLRSLLDLSRELSVLVVGLGNQEITADSLGPPGGKSFEDDPSHYPGIRSLQHGRGEDAPDQRNRSGSNGSDRHGNPGNHSGGGF